MSGSNEREFNKLVELSMRIHKYINGTNFPWNISKCTDSQLFHLNVYILQRNMFSKIKNDMKSTVIWYFQKIWTFRGQRYSTETKVLAFMWPPLVWPPAPLSTTKNTKLGVSLSTAGFAVLFILFQETNNGKKKNVLKTY